MGEDVSTVLIVAIVFSFVSFNVYMKYRSKELAGGASKVQEAIQDENIALKAKILELEARIQVLESIVTNKSFRLDDEINSLS